MNCCNKCGKLSGILVLLIGIAFALVDWGVWNFWNLEWWTVAFLLAGLFMLAMGSCPDCGSCCSVKSESRPASRKRKKK